MWCWSTMASEGNAGRDLMDSANGLGNPQQHYHSDVNSASSQQPRQQQENRGEDERSVKFSGAEDDGGRQRGRAMTSAPQGEDDRLYRERFSSVNRDTVPPSSDPVVDWVQSTLNEVTLSKLETPKPGGLPANAFPPRTKHTKASHKKLPAVTQRKWLMIDSAGNTEMVTLVKSHLTQTLGIQLRDLRLLDPKLATSYPAAILCRERSLVVNLEFIKMIVGLDRCYVTNLDDENTQDFVRDLQRRLQSINRGLPPSKSIADLNALEGNTHPGTALPAFDELPFELRAIEVALDFVTKYLEQLTSDLEAAAHPALDSLTAKVTSDTLERVRRIKNRMVRLTTRVETLREVLEKYLDDDSDMADMNLTAQVAREAQEKAVAAAKSVQPFDMLSMQGAKTPGSPRSGTLTYDTDEEEEEAIEEVEQLLETFFLQLDNTWNKLQTLTEYIDDTEDYINIELDSKRNQLIRLDLVLTAFSASMALVTAMTSLFAMNVALVPNSDKTNGPFSWFIAISAAAGATAILVFSGVMLYSRWKRLI